jgi:hypothetical protein
MIEKSAPSSVAALKRSLADVEQLMDPQQRMWEDLNVLAGKGSVDMLLEAAPKVSVQMRNAYYQRAAQVARDQGMSNALVRSSTTAYPMSGNVGRRLCRLSNTCSRKASAKEGLMRLVDY